MASRTIVLAAAPCSSARRLFSCQWAIESASGATFSAYARSWLNEPSCRCCDSALIVPICASKLMRLVNVEILRLANQGAFRLVTITACPTKVVEQLLEELGEPISITRRICWWLIPIPKASFATTTLRWPWMNCNWVLSFLSCASCAALRWMNSRSFALALSTARCRGCPREQLGAEHRGARHISTSLRFNHMADTVRR